MGITPGLCTSLGVEAKLLSCCEQPSVIGDELAKVGPELPGALEVDGVKGADFRWQQHTSGAEDAVAHTDYVDPIEDGSSSGQGRVALKEQRTEDFCASERVLEIKGVRRRRCLRSAIDSGSSTTSLTIAEESRYVAGISVRCPEDEQGPPRRARALLMAAGRGGRRGPRWRRRPRRRGGAVAEGSQPAAV